MTSSFCFIGPTGSGKTTSLISFFGETFLSHADKGNKKTFSHLREAIIVTAKKDNDTFFKTLCAAADITNVTFERYENLSSIQADLLHVKHALIIFDDYQYKLSDGEFITSMLNVACRENHLCFIVICHVVLRGNFVLTIRAQLNNFAYVVLFPMNKTSVEKIVTVWFNSRTRKNLDDMVHFIIDYLIQPSKMRHVLYDANGIMALLQPTKDDGQIRPFGLFVICDTTESTKSVSLRSGSPGFPVLKTFSF